jgi:hypothetical protein
MACYWISNGKDMPREIKRAEIIRVSVSPKEKAELIKAADKEAMPFGIYVRSVALKVRGPGVAARRHLWSAMVRSAWALRAPAPFVV